MLVLVIVFAFCFWVPMWLPSSPVGLNFWVLQYHIPMDDTLRRHMCLLVMVFSSFQECIVWLFLPLLHVQGAAHYTFSCPLAVAIGKWAHLWHSCGGQSQHLCEWPSPLAICKYVRSRLKLCWCLQVGFALYKHMHISITCTLHTALTLFTLSCTC